MPHDTATPDTQRGLYSKYDVTRLDDPDGKHATCPFFVLDFAHDIHARRALMAYAESCAGDYPQLATDLRRLLLTTTLER